MSASIRLKRARTPRLQIQNPGIVAEPADGHRCQVGGRIHHGIERATIQRQLRPSADLGTPVVVSRPRIRHPERITPQQEGLSADVHALGRADIAEEVPTKLDPQTGGNRSKGNGPPIFRLVGTQQNS